MDKINKQQLQKALNQCYPIIIKDEFKGCLNAMLLDFENQEAVAFNSKQGIVASLPYVENTTFKLGHKDVNLLKHTINQSRYKTVGMVVYHTSVEFYINNECLTLLKHSVDNTFPNYRPLLPKQLQCGFKAYLPDLKRQMVKLPKEVTFARLNLTTSKKKLKDELTLEFLDKENNVIQKCDLAINGGYHNHLDASTLTFKFYLKQFKQPVNKMKAKEIKFTTDDPYGECMTLFESDCKFLLMPVIR